ncbi:MAG: hypothetical protein OXT67_07050 [Zetaproteobacteria bacterium]|nr:hypothetical protein [Zetaproteobacteria bacterium]
MLVGRANQESVLQTFYDMHPYPSYPFAARPRFQEGIWANPRFHLHRAGLKAGSRPLKVLIGGAGAILPAVIGSWLCPNDVLIVNDLSARSLRRAKFAMRWRHLFQNRWFVEPLQATLQRFPHNFLDHADLFGVLHHMSHPEDVLVPLFDCLKPGATVRVMVYHHHGRELVRRVRDRVAPFSPFEPRDIMKARARVRALADDKDWQSFFAAIGPAWKVSDADFVDRFMHPLERYFSIVQWLGIFREVGFHLTAVMDR